MAALLGSWRWSHPSRVFVITPTLRSYTFDRNHLWENARGTAPVALLRHGRRTGELHPRRRGLLRLAAVAQPGDRQARTRTRRAPDRTPTARPAPDRGRTPLPRTRRADPPPGGRGGRLRLRRRRGRPTRRRGHPDRRPVPATGR